ncbi:O-antigen ligase family protein [Larsenimonas suaedae]|uniref:O-antigen ligase family protein n=1 Tax=Larsenimonas suaedae TaxID=1851019 RepID=A0ABU1GVD8_9GAMM|nr:O-antigen ligase family protein [Larsenimonas suaedae]MCM2971292.1 O-antigen ligase family protein [Larsenimonas suaedae]MDR5896002.1 O-antigen ligase family protein [Larsenimonas suaedae]
MKGNNHFLSLFAQMGMFLTLALTLSLDGGYSYGAIIVLLGSLLGLGAFRLYRGQRLAREDRQLLLVFVLYGLSFLFFRAYHVFEWSGLDKPSRFILVCLIFLFLRSVALKGYLLWLGAAVGTYSGVGVAIYQHFIDDKARANGFQHPIMFGNFGVLLGMICFAGFIFYIGKKQYTYAFLMFLAGVSGLLVSILSGSRGGWLAIPVGLVYLFWQSRDVIGARLVKQAAVFFVAAMVAVIAIPQTGVSHRIGQAVSDIENYVEPDGSARTSVGLRFEMWKAALHLYKESPILGVGEFDIQAKKQVLADEGIIDQAAVHFGHAHNEYLTNLSEYGTIGFILLMILYIVPLRLFNQKIRAYPSDWNIRCYAMAGGLIPACYMDFALSQSMFSHNSGVMLFSLGIMYFWSVVRNLEAEKAVG